MLVCEALSGWRVIAEPASLDAMVWSDESLVLRISPDDVVVLAGPEPVVSDPHAIVVVEHGFAGAVLSAAELDSIAREHIEWQLPVTRPALAQGQIAGVPAKLWLHTDGTALLLVAAAARRELESRLAANIASTRAQTPRTAVRHGGAA